MGIWKLRKRRPPWVEPKTPVEYRAMQWLLNRGFWKNVAVNVVSAAIIALGSTYFLAIAIYSKHGSYLGIRKINLYYLGLFLLLAMLAIAYKYYSVVHKINTGFRIFGIVIVFFGSLWVGVILYAITYQQVTNLVNTLDLEVREGPLPNSRVFPHLLYDEFGNPRYMDDVPYSAS